MKIKAKAWVTWHYVSNTISGRILRSLITEFEGTCDELQEETEKRNEESKRDVTVIVHQTAILSPPSL